MGGRSIIRAFSLLGLGFCLSFSQPVQAQARKHVRIHRHLHLRVHPQQAVSRPPPPRRTGPWDASRSSFILSAESLFGFAYAREVETFKLGAGEATHTTSGPSIHLFKGSELLDPFSNSRLGMDGVVGPGFTFGGSLGYSMFDATARTTGTGVATDNSPVGVTVFTVVPRLGVLLAPSRYLGVWLRGGVGYTSLKLARPSQDVSANSWDLVLDPMLVVTPLPHVGLLVGPSLNFGLAGTEESPDAPAGGTFTNTWSSYGVSAGIALLF
jgi:hypothetical protein